MMNYFQFTIKSQFKMQEICQYLKFGLSNHENNIIIPHLPVLPCEVVSSFALPLKIVKRFQEENNSNAEFTSLIFHLLLCWPSSSIQPVFSCSYAFKQMCICTHLISCLTFVVFLGSRSNFDFKNMKR